MKQEPVYSLVEAKAGMKVRHIRSEVSGRLVNIFDVTDDRPGTTLGILWDDPSGDIHVTVGVDAWFEEFEVVA